MYFFTIKKIYFIIINTSYIILVLWYKNAIKENKNKKD